MDDVKRRIGLVGHDGLVDLGAARSLREVGLMCTCVAADKPKGRGASCFKQEEGLKDTGVADVNCGGDATKPIVSCEELDLGGSDCRAAKPKGRNASCFKQAEGLKGTGVAVSKGGGDATTPIFSCEELDLGGSDCRAAKPKGRIASCFKHDGMQDTGVPVAKPMGQQGGGDATRPIFSDKERDLGGSDYRDQKLKFYKQKNV
jgi:hypothetical protein